MVPRIARRVPAYLKKVERNASVQDGGDEGRRRVTAGTNWIPMPLNMKVAKRGKEEAKAFLWEKEKRRESQRHARKRFATRTHHESLSCDGGRSVLSVGVGEVVVRRQEDGVDPKDDRYESETRDLERNRETCRVSG